MITRCYGKRNQDNATYERVVVCDEWLTFSNFRAWMEKQDWEGKELDKDLLGSGYLYNPRSCAFVNKITNSLIRHKKDNGLPWGVNPVTTSPGKFKAESRDLQSKRCYLGCYDSPIKAHKAWQKFKAQLFTELSLQESDSRVSLRLQEIAARLLSDMQSGRETKDLKNNVDF